MLRRGERWLLFWERRPRALQSPASRQKNKWPCICHKLSFVSAIPLPVCFTRPRRGVCVPFCCRILHLTQVSMCRPISNQTAARRFSPACEPCPHCSGGRFCRRRPNAGSVAGPSRHRAPFTRGWSAYLAMVRLDTFLPQHPHQHRHSMHHESC